MACSLASTPTPSSASAIATATARAASNLGLCCYGYSSSNLSFRLSPKPISKLRFFTKGSQPSGMLCPTARVNGQLNEVAVDGSSISNSAAASKTKSEVADTKEPSSEPSSGVLATEESVSQFITQVASLVKLVDSRDIVELKLKQLDCEVTVRKKEAMLPQAQSPAQVAMIHSSPSPLPVVPPVTPASTPSPSPSPSAPTLSTSPAVKSAPAKSSHSPLKCPMAGTFYRSPAPGEPPFVKVGDKVKKGQVLCIIEAMKLMNEIELQFRLINQEP